jgi:hypothetical protein
MKISKRAQQAMDDIVATIRKGDVAGWLGYKVMIENIIDRSDRSEAYLILAVAGRLLPEETRKLLRLR